MAASMDEEEELPCLMAMSKKGREGGMCGHYTQRGTREKHFYHFRMNSQKFDQICVTFNAGLYLLSAG